MIILAIFPVLIPIAALAALGGLFAFLGKKKKADTAGELDEPGEPSPDPMTPGVVPFIQLRSGTTYVRLDRRGETWSFRVEGPVPATGGDADSGKAAVDMLQSFAASNNTDDVAGEAASADGTDLAFGVQEDEGGRWEWSVTRTNGPGPQMLASGEEATRTTALLKMLSAISDALDWLNVPSMDGGGVPMPPPEPPTVVHGIVTTGNRLAVVNINAWLAYASPLVREDLEAGKTADQIMGELLDPDNIGVDDDYRFNGKPGSIVRAHVQKIYDEIKDGKYLGTPSPDDELAAAIVGFRYEPKDNFVMRWHGGTLLARPEKGGAAAAALNIDPRYEYLIWEGDMRGYDTDVVARETLDAGKKRNQAVNAAKAAIDGLPDAGDVDDGATVDPDWNQQPFGGVQYGTGVVQPQDVTPIDQSSAIKNYTLTAPSWKTRSSKDITIFDFADGNNAKRKDWTIGIGVCITIDGNAPFGSTLETAIRTGYFGDGGAGGLGDPILLWGIKNANGTRMDFDSFRAPLAFKRQFVGKFERGNPLKITKPLEDVTKTAASDDLDTCPGLDQQWPTPDSSGGFTVVGKGQNGVAVKWDEAPRFKIIHAGTKIIMRVTYSGFPEFFRPAGAASFIYALTVPRKFNLAVKVWASGINL